MRLRGLELVYNGATIGFLTARRHNHRVELPRSRVRCRDGGVVAGRPRRRLRDGCSPPIWTHVSSRDTAAPTWKCGPTTFRVVLTRTPPSTWSTPAGRSNRSPRPRHGVGQPFRPPCARAVGCSSKMSTLAGRWRLHWPEYTDSVRTHSTDHERLYRAVEVIFASVGADASFGTRLAGLLEAAGLRGGGR